MFIHPWLIRIVHRHPPRFLKLHSAARPDKCFLHLNEKNTGCSPIVEDPRKDLLDRSLCLGLGNATIVP